MAEKIKISVKLLVEFVLRTGHLQAGTPGLSRAVEGVKAHQKVQKSRPEGYQAEVPLTYPMTIDHFTLEIGGRADGIYEEDGILTIEEIKSTLTPLSELTEGYAAHWAQAHCYAYIYAVQNALSSVRVQLTYYQLDEEAICSFYQTVTLEELTVLFENLVQPFIHWQSLVMAWRRKRDASIQTLDFPFPQYRSGQRELAVATYKTIQTGSKLFAQAPTGIGKTIATLFPAVKAMGAGQISQIFYLTAKTITREIAEKALDTMRASGLAIKTVTITAKEKICLRGDALCDPDLCPYARDYFSKINAAVEDLFQHHDDLNRRLIEEYAEKHQICPFEFSLDVALAVDCIICDYNYLFDPRVYLRRFFMEQGDYCFLIDEAHNLVDRAREMFSATLEKKPILELRRATKVGEPSLSHHLNALNTYLIQLRKQCEAEEEGHYLVWEELPKELVSLVETVCIEAEMALARNLPVTYHDELLEMYFTVNTFLRVAEGYDERFVTYVEKAGNDLRVKLFCLDPSARLQASLKKGKAAIFFSATLTPLDYFADILGGEEGDHRFRVASPFPREHLCLLVVDSIGTTYKAREFTYDKVVEAVAAMVQQRKGNYLVYLPSYKYMNEVLARFNYAYPDIRLIYQRTGMSEEEREEFLAAFGLENPDSLVGFAVMGGVFGEGIDLTGDRLSGTAIVGVGLPQVCLEREIIRGYFAEKNSLGFEYAYIYPGMNKVLQAAGRVIRTETDRGVVLLIDERFSYPTYRELFPVEWYPVVRARTPEKIRQAVTLFWNEE